MNAFCLLEIISVDQIMQPFLMRLKDAIALKFAIFANKNKFRYFTAANHLHRRLRQLKPVTLTHFPRSLFGNPPPPAQRQDNDDNCLSTSSATHPFHPFLSISLPVYSPPRLQQFCQGLPKLIQSQTMSCFLRGLLQTQRLKLLSL